MVLLAPDTNSCFPQHVCGVLLLVAVDVVVVGEEEEVAVGNLHFQAPVRHHHRHNQNTAKNQIYP